MPLIDYTKAIALKAQGLSYREMAELMQVNAKSLRVGFCRKQLNKTVDEITQRDADLRAKRCLATFDELHGSSRSVRANLAKVTEKASELLAKVPPTSPNELANTKDGQGLASVLKTLVESADTLYGWSDQKVIGVIDARVMEAAFKEPASIVDVQAQVNTDSVANTTTGGSSESQPTPSTPQVTQ